MVLLNPLSRDSQDLAKIYEKRLSALSSIRAIRVIPSNLRLGGIPRVAWTVCVNDETAKEMFVHCDIAGPLSRYANVQHVCRRTPAP